MFWIRLPFSISKSATLPPSPAAARTMESARQLRLVTPPSTAGSRWNSSPVSASRTKIPPARSAEATSTPSGLKATAVTQSVWPPPS